MIDTMDFATFFRRALATPAAPGPGPFAYQQRLAMGPWPFATASMT